MARVTELGVPYVAPIKLDQPLPAKDYNIVWIYSIDGGDIVFQYYDNEPQVFQSAAPQSFVPILAHTILSSANINGKIYQTTSQSLQYGAHPAKIGKVN